METISNWLGRIGLSQYSNAFEANEITLEIAATLSDDDLRELGVGPLGHRRLLTTAIAALHDSKVCIKPTPLERRHLTVMFCDLVGSTSLATTIDAERLADIIAKYEYFCADVVARHDGFVARYVGDGLLVYFGYPVALEDSAERAIRAALSIVKEIETVETLPGLQLRVRIGIATGHVVVGDIGDRGANRDAVIGQTPNLAARLQGHAGENEIVMADATHRLAGFLFHCSPMDNLAVRGFPEPIKAWRVRSERLYRGRFEARRITGLTRFVGREAEFGILTESWGAVARRNARVVLVTGEAGIGKSRLVGQFIAAISQHRHRLLTFFGSPHLQNSPLRPIIHELEQEAQIVASDTASVKRGKLQALLSSTPALMAEATPILSALLSLRRDPSDPDLDPDARRRKHQTLDILARWLEACAEIEPIVCVCEDVHWFDPTSCEFLAELIARLAKSRVLLIVTFRPKFRPAWIEQPHVKTTRLDRLSPALGTKIVENLAAHAALSHEMTQLIVSKCDGVPLFIEELTKTVLESHAAEPDDRDHGLVAIPDSLQDSLVARLDRLSGVKEIAQIGAAIGREFPVKILQAVSGVARPKLNIALRKLTDAELIEQHDQPDGTIGVFKHALVQDAVYETLLQAKQRSIHRRIAEVLEKELSQTSDTPSEILALHWERAGEFTSAAHYFTLAGKQAASRSATTEADRHFRLSLRVCAQISAGAERDQLELDATLQRGGVLRATQGPHGAETGRAFLRARDLCLQIGNEQSLFPALTGLFGYYLVGAQNNLAGETARSLLAVAEACEDRFYSMVGHRAVGMVHLHGGEPNKARVHLERSLELYDERLDGPAAFSYGTDHAQTAASFLALTLEVLGYAEQAAAREVWAVAHGTKLNHRYSLVQTAMFRIMRSALGRDWDTVRIVAEDTYAIGQEHGFPLAGAMARVYLAVCRVVHGDVNKQLLEELDRAINALGRMNYHPFYLSLLAEAHAASGDVCRGLELLVEAELIAEASQERWMCAELLRLRGEMTLISEPSAIEKALSLFEQAAELAERRGARNWHLRSVTSLARLLALTGRIPQARARLAPLYASFTEGFSNPDLRSARSLLDALSAGPGARELSLVSEKYRFW